MTSAEPPFRYPWRLRKGSADTAKPKIFFFLNFFQPIFLLTLIKIALNFTFKVLKQLLRTPERNRP